AALAELDVVAVEVETGTPDDPAPQDGVMLRGTDLPGPDDVPLEGSVALLPALDPTTMGWAARDWYLGPHKAAVFDTIGNAGATVWWEGRIVGAWAVRPG